MLKYGFVYDKIKRRRLKLKMVTREEEEYILTQAYVPEHVVSLMGSISKGEPFLVENYLLFTKDNWLIFIGYSLDRHFDQERCEAILKRMVGSFHPEYLWFIGPEIPPSLLGSCTERQKDEYYVLEIQDKRPKPSLQHIAEKVSETLRVDQSQFFSKEHQALVTEFLKREKLSPQLKELYLAMPQYVSQSKDAWLLNARDKKGRLSAFYVIDQSAEEFMTYVIGCHSKKNYIPHASDLLFFEMIRHTRNSGKKKIHLGLGVNEGIRRFKKKWGGVPYLNYECCEYYYGVMRTTSLIKELEGKL